MRSQLSVVIDNCIFDTNYGPNSAHAGAVSIDGLQYEDSNVTLYNHTQYQLVSETVHYGINKALNYTGAKFGHIQVMRSVFDQNLAGVSGAALNLVNINNSYVVIDDNKFTKNTGAFGMLEEKFKLPFYDILLMRKSSLNFFVKPELSKKYKKAKFLHEKREYTLYNG